jgi:integrase
MPRRRKGPRLYLDPRRKQWVIRDGASFARTGIGESDARAAERWLAQYIDQKHGPAPSRDPLINEVLSAYGTEVAKHRRTAKNIAYNIGSLVAWWGEKRASEVTERACRAYAATKTGPAAAQDLKTLQAALRHWHKEHGPLASEPKAWKPEGGGARERWLTVSEAARLLWAARRVPRLARMILIGLRTGSRPGVVRALQWSWLDLDRGLMYRRAPGAVDAGNKRSPPVRLGRKIIGHLKRWKRIDGDRCPWVVHYDGAPVDDPHTSWARAVTKAGLPGVTPHVLRHTRATWLMHAGIDPWKAAGSLGMSLRTLLRVYGHHHHDHHGGAEDV